MKEYNFENFCLVKSSKRIFANQYTNAGIPFYRGKEITLLSMGQSIYDLLYISEQAFQQVKTNGMPENNDILITAVGTIGSIWLVDTNKPFYFKDGNIIWLSKINQNIVLPKYLKYAMISSRFQKKIEEVAIGSNQKALTIDSVKKLQISFPKIETQQHIVDILGSIDEKIENNEQEIRKINDLALCFIAKSNNLNTELKPYIKFIKGKKPIENGSTTAPYLSIDAITSFRYESVYSDDMIMATPFDILMVMDGASSGTVFSHQAGVVSSTIAKIDCSDNIKDYLYWYLLSQKVIIKSRNTGSAIPHANKEYISSLKFDYGFATDIKTINILHSLRTKIIQLQEENKKLQELKGLYLKKFFE